MKEQENKKKKMHLIILQGCPGIGKTTTIKLFWEILKEAGGKVEEYGDPQFKPFPDSTPPPPELDIKGIIVWQDFKIGVFSGGDSSRYVDDAIKDFDSCDHKCAIVVGALSLGKRNVYAEKRIKEYPHERISKTISEKEDEESRNQANRKDAEAILEKVRAAASSLSKS